MEFICYGREIINHIIDDVISEFYLKPKTIYENKALYTFAITHVNCKFEFKIIMVFKWCMIKTSEINTNV